MATTECSSQETTALDMGAESLSAYKALDWAFVKFAAYGVASNKGTLAEDELPAPTVVTLSKGTDPRLFAAEVSDCAMPYWTKTKIVEVETAAASDDSVEAAQRALAWFGRSYRNGLVVMLEGIDVAEEQKARRDQIRRSVAELTMPSMIIYSADL